VSEWEDTTRTDRQKPSRIPVAPDMVFDRNLLFFAFFFTVFLFLLYQLARILSPFLAPLLAALMISLIFYPLNTWLRGLIHNKDITAGIATVTVLLTIIIPVILLLWALIIEATNLLPLARSVVSKWEAGGFDALGSAVPQPLQQLWTKVLPYIERWNVDLQSMLTTSVRDLGNSITTFGAATLREVFRFLLNLIVLVLVLYFFFRDGDRVIERVITLVPMEKANKELIVTRLDRTLVAIVRGAFATASAQGLLSGIGLAVAGVPFSLLLGFLSALLSLVPFVGASLIWAPASVYLLLNDQTLAGIGLIAWGLCVVGLVDNFIRPWVVGKHAQLPVLPLLVGILGGLQVYGLIGALISPLIVATVMVFAQIYHDQYLLKQHPQDAPKDAG
jgi:predicted PurR-regulated permease PerM